MHRIAERMCVCVCLCLCMHFWRQCFHGWWKANGADDSNDNNDDDDDDDDDFWGNVFPQHLLAATFCCISWRHIAPKYVSMLYTNTRTHTLTSREIYPQTNTYIFLCINIYIFANMKCSCQRIWPADISLDVDVEMFQKSRKIQ